MYIYFIKRKTEMHFIYYQIGAYQSLDGGAGGVGIGTSRFSSPSFSKSGCRKFSYLSISLLPAARIVKCASRARRFSPVHPGIWF